MAGAGRLLDEDGPIAGAVDGFAPRAEQQALADAVERTLEQGGTLIGEAGTGVGKTFAYLGPAWRGGDKVITSPGTRHLRTSFTTATSRACAAHWACRYASPC